jgi:mycothiol system anti-sigma-R factor
LPAAGECSGPDGSGDCREAVAELFTYLDGALTDERRARIAGHLDGCSGCFDAFEFHAELKSVISKRCQTEVPAGLRQRIRAALAAASEPDPSG